MKSHMSISYRQLTCFLQKQTRRFSSNSNWKIKGIDSLYYKATTPMISENKSINSNLINPTFLTHKEHTLSNGIKILTESNGTPNYTGINISFRVGYRDEDYHTCGTLTAICDTLQMHVMNLNPGIKPMISPSPEITTISFSCFSYMADQV